MILRDVLYLFVLFVIMGFSQGCTQSEKEVSNTVPLKSLSSLDDHKTKSFYKMVEEDYFQKLQKSTSEQILNCYYAEKMKSALSMLTNSRGGTENNSEFVELKKYFQESLAIAYELKSGVSVKDLPKKYYFDTPFNKAYRITTGVLVGDKNKAVQEMGKQFEDCDAVSSGQYFASRESVAKSQRIHLDQGLILAKIQSAEK